MSIEELAKQFAEHGHIYAYRRSKKYFYVRVEVTGGYLDAFQRRWGGRVKHRPQRLWQLTETWRIISLCSDLAPHLPEDERLPAVREFLRETRRGRERMYPELRKLLRE